MNKNEKELEQISTTDKLKAFKALKDAGLRVEMSGSGVPTVVCVSPLDIDKEIKALTDGYGCDIYIEATGNPASVRQGLTIIRKLGTFVEFSVFGKETTVDWSIIGDSKELDIRGSHLSPYAYPFVIENMQKGNIKTDGVVSHTFKLEDWETAFDYATGKYGDFKVAFVFD